MLDQHCRISAMPITWAHLSVCQDATECHRRKPSFCCWTPSPTQLWFKSDLSPTNGGLPFFSVVSDVLNKEEKSYLRTKESIWTLTTRDQPSDKNWPAVKSRPIIPRLPFSWACGSEEVKSPLHTSDFLFSVKFKLANNCCVCLLPNMTLSPGD